MESDEIAAPYNSHEADGDHASSCTAADGASGDDESEADPSAAAAGEGGGTRDTRPGGAVGYARAAARATEATAVAEWCACGDALVIRPVALDEALFGREMRQFAGQTPPRRSARR